MTPGKPTREHFPDRASYRAARAAYVTGDRAPRTETPMNFLNDIAELKAAVASLTEAVQNVPATRAWIVRVNDRDILVTERDGMTLTAGLLMAIETRKPVAMKLVNGVSITLREGDFAMVMAQILAKQNAETLTAEAVGASGGEDVS